MKIGLQIPDFNWPGNPQNLGAKLIEIAKTAEEAGFYAYGRWIISSR